VEDERRMADLLRQGLAEEGHSVTIASDGEDAIGLAERHALTWSFLM
jgi:DNA-binding response OmpR family regulator